MKLVLLTALGVGGATIIGALIGFVFKKASHKFNDIILSFAAGVMLAASVVWSIFLPSSFFFSIPNSSMNAPLVPEPSSLVIMEISSSALNPSLPPQPIIPTANVSAVSTDTNFFFIK